MSIKHAFILALCSALSAGGAQAAPDTPIPLRISVDTTPTHPRNIWLDKFAAAVRERSKGRIVPQVFHSGQLYKDSNVAKALKQDGIDMALPGTWTLGGFEKRMTVLELPLLVGRSTQEVYGISDGPIGKELAAAIEDKLDAKVLGRWWIVGYGQTYMGATKVSHFNEMAGKKIRYPGGAVAAARYQALGVTPVLVPWPDVPLALSRGTFDGLTSTLGTVVSTKLWESGLKWIYLDNGSLGQYVPLVSKAFWKKLPPDLQKVMVDAWEEFVPGQRDAVIKDEHDLLAELQRNGVQFVKPAPREIAAMRAILLTTQDKVVREMGIDPAFVKRIDNALR